MKSNVVECNFTFNMNTNGVLGKYTRPEPIGENDRYFLAVVIRFAGTAFMVEGDLIIRFSGCFPSELTPELNKVTYGNGSEVMLVIYELGDWDLENIKSGGKVETINFRTEEGISNILTVKEKGDLLKNHYNCLQ